MKFGQEYAAALRLNMCSTAPVVSLARLAALCCLLPLSLCFFFVLRCSVSSTLSGFKFLFDPLCLSPVTNLWRPQCSFSLRLLCVSFLWQAQRSRPAKPDRGQRGLAPRRTARRASVVRRIRAKVRLVTISDGQPSFGRPGAGQLVAASSG